MSKLLKSLAAELTPSWMKKKDAAPKAAPADSRGAAERAARRASAQETRPPKPEKKNG